MSQFDIFLSHNSQDKPVVREIKQRLAELEVSAWLDEDELPPGQNWIPLLEQAMSNCKSAGAFVGGNGIGPWEDEEIQQALDEVFWPRIHRKYEYYSWYTLGAFGDDLAAVANFFSKPWCLSVVGMRIKSEALA